MKWGKESLSRTSSESSSLDDSSGPSPSSSDVSGELSKSISIHPKVSYQERESKPDVNYHFFSYSIRITNHSKVPVQLISRYWLITDANGQEEEVRGAGVVGQQPVISPGQTYEYESNCPCSTSSCSMRGSYQMLAPSTNERFEVPIPEFYLIAPFALH